MYIFIENDSSFNNFCFYIFSFRLLNLRQDVFNYIVYISIAREIVILPYERSMKENTKSPTWMHPVVYSLNSV